ncbi:hypothetical protein [Minwuia thermotolerans]|uniref:Uncharacterized protein n=1 Tax=Minwuia thermotolerans TaxID=2056226 RepID=A0A2M9G4S8_9PROT|nr:hypothetical protein [Minwuia thermotolerans]PJK29313.1 hypothetical protein CVT23_11965 [Minwuia thermotolerans]PJK30502.1 hypothetical protein CVT23_06030 [Minwuia thermotolerans]PJK30725.1 hypothetical protein CVT23_04980 [Minwuia thermotolerans]
MAAGMTWSRETRKHVRRLAKAGLEPAEIAARTMKPYQAIRDFIDLELKDARSTPEASMLNDSHPAPTRPKAISTSVDRSCRPENKAVTPACNEPRPLDKCCQPTPATYPATSLHASPPAAKPQPAIKQASKPVEKAIEPARAPSFPALPARRPQEIARTSLRRSAEEQAAIDAFLAKGKVTKLPPGHAAGISAIEMEHHAAPLSIEQLKGGAARLKRQREAGRNGRRIRDAKRGVGK